MTKTAIVGGDIPPWAGIADAAVLSAGATAAALTALEIHRATFVDSQRAPATRLVRAATELGRGDLRRRAQLVLADSIIRQGDPIEGSALARRVQTEAQSDGDAFALARAHYLLAWVAYSIDDAASAQVNALRGVELLSDDAHPAIVIEHLVIVAVALSPAPEATDYFARAMTVAQEFGDPAHIIAILNNKAYSALRAGNLPLATANATEMTACLADTATVATAAQLDTIARVYIANGRNEEAAHALEPIRRVLSTIAEREDPADGARASGGVRGMVTLAQAYRGMVTLAQAYRGLGRLDDVDDLLTHADAVVPTAPVAPLRRVRASILQERARLYAARGAFEQAYGEYVSFHRAAMALQAEDERNRALIVKAAVDADRNRRRAQHFRELAMRDALTGIHNRRYLDELLTTVAATPNGGPLSVAIIDIDHFKRVNDDFSHDVGDEVLRALASVLVDTAPPSATVCRFGGEEFVAVMPDTDAATGLAICESIRRAVERRAWPPLPEDRPITISIGVSTADIGGITRTEMLSNADRNLYAAKRSGRNRVIGDAR